MAFKKYNEYGEASAGLRQEIWWHGRYSAHVNLLLRFLCIEVLNPPKPIQKRERERDRQKGS